MSKKKVMFKKTSSILWVVLKKKFSSVSRIRIKKKKKLRVTMKRGSILRVIFCWWKIFWKENSSLWVIRSQILWVFFLVKKSLWVMLKKGFNSSSHSEKNLWVILKKKVQFFVSYFWWKLNSLSRFLNKNSKIQFFDSCSKKFNSSSHAQKNSILSTHAQEISILWVFFFSKKFNSSSHVKEGSIHWVLFKKVQFFESYKKKGSILWVNFFWGEKSFIFFFEKIF